MTDLASLTLAVDSTQVKSGTAALDGLTAAGKRAETATAGLASTTRGAAAQGMAMAEAAQVQAAAATKAAGGLHGMGLAGNNARIVALELTHVTRSLSEQLAAGVSPARALTMELGRISTAVQYSGGIGALARTIGGMLAPFTGLIAAAAGLGLAFEGVKKQAEAIDPAGKQLISTLGLTHKEVEKLKDTTVSWGDVAVATFSVIAGAAGTSASAISSSFGTAFRAVADFARFSASVVLGSFAAAVKGVHSMLADLGHIGTNLASAWHGGGAVSTNPLTNPLKDAKDQFFKSFGDVESGFDKIAAEASKRRDARIRDQANKIIGDRTPKKPKKGPGDHGLAESLDKLDAEIRGQLALAAAYGVSDAAALKAEAALKAHEQAIQHHANATQRAAFEQKNLALILAQGAADGAKHAAQLRDEAGIRQHVNAMVAAGVIPASKANDQLKLETELLPLQVRASLATGAAKKQLLDVIKQLTAAQNALNAATAHGNALEAIAANDKELARARLERGAYGQSERERSIGLAGFDAAANAKGYNQADTAKVVEQARQLAALRFRSPFDEWLRGAADVKGALEDIKARGLEGLSSSITDAIMGAKSLGQAFRDVARSIIADIIRMTVRMLIFKALTAILGGGFGGFGTFGKGAAFSGGSVKPFAAGGIVTSPTLFPMANGGTGLMGEAGPEAVMPLARDPRGRLGVRAANGNSPVNLTVNVNARDAVLTEAVKGWIVQGIAEAAPHIARASSEATFKAAGRRPLMGR